MAAVLIRKTRKDVALHTRLCDGRQDLLPSLSNSVLFRTPARAIPASESGQFDSTDLAAKSAEHGLCEVAVNHGYADT